MYCLNLFYQVVILESTRMLEQKETQNVGVLKTELIGKAFEKKKKKGTWKYMQYF